MSTLELLPCNKDVFDHGITIGVTDVPKAEAEALCKEKSARTGDHYDWHYAGGRVVVKCLTKERAAELLAEREHVVEFEKLKQLVPELAAALKPFADCCEHIDSDEEADEWAKFRLLVKNYRDAKVALDKVGAA